MTRVLLAEDDEDLRVLAGLMLQPPAWDLVLAEDGSVALDAVTGGGFDAMVLDIDMPGASGIAVARHARACGHAGPVVLWSGWVASTDPAVVDELDAVAVEKIDVFELQVLLTSLLEG